MQWIIHIYEIFLWIFQSIPYNFSTCILLLFYLTLSSFPRIFIFFLTLTFPVIHFLKKNNSVTFLRFGHCLTTQGYQPPVQVKLANTFPFTPNWIRYEKNLSEFTVMLKLMVLLVLTIILKLLHNLNNKFSGPYLQTLCSRWGHYFCE